MLCNVTAKHAVRGTRQLRVSSAPAAVRGHRVVVIVRSGEGVPDLISRDRKEIQLTDAFDDNPAAPAAEAPATSTSSDAAPASPSQDNSSRPQRRTGPKTRKQRQAALVQAAEAASSSSSSSSATAAGPAKSYKRCKEAIDAGLASFTGKQYEEAIQLFNLALELPGNGAYRLSGSPREYACPSDAEEHAALYNMACCYAQLGQKAAALTCLEAILESGFDDVQSINSDPDLKPVQGQELQAVINKYTGIGGVFSKLLRKDKQEVLVSDQNKNKPWIMW